MEYERRFKVLISSPAFDEKGLEGQRLQQIATEIEALGFAVLRARRAGRRRTGGADRCRDRLHRGGLGQAGAAGQIGVS